MTSPTLPFIPTNPEDFWYMAIQDLLILGHPATATEVMEASQFDYGSSGPDAALMGAVSRGMVAYENQDSDNPSFLLTDLGRGVASGRVPYVWAAEATPEAAQETSVEPPVPPGPKKAPVPDMSALPLEERLGDSYLDTLMRLVNTTAEYETALWKRNHPLSTLVDIGEIEITLTIGTMSESYGVNLAELQVTDRVAQALGITLAITPVPLKLGDGLVLENFQIVLGGLLKTSPIRHILEIVCKSFDVKETTALSFLEANRHYLQILARNHHV